MRSLRTRQVVLAGGGTYCLAYALATAIRPFPETYVGALAANSVLVLPGLLAASTTVWAAARSRGAERGFWILLALAVSSRTLAHLLLASPDMGLPMEPVRTLGRVALYNYVIFFGVALLVRPDRPRGSGRIQTAMLDWIMAVVGGYFLIFYLFVLPAGRSDLPWFVPYVLPHAVLVLAFAAVAVLVRTRPFGPVYRLLAAGLVVSLLVGMPQAWMAPSHGLSFWSPWNVGWALALVPVAAAALSPRGPVWVRSGAPSNGDRHRSRLAVLAAALPPMLDLSLRALGVQPELAYQRSQWALATSAFLSLVMTLRLRREARPARDVIPIDTPEARTALGEPSEFLQLASGTAHELNNPLMAVAGWAELAMRRGAPREGPAELLAAVRKAASAVQRLQRLARSARGPESQGS